MFAPIKNELDKRLSEAEAFFRAVNALGEAPAVTAKGLAFVQMYAAYEYTVCTVVQTAIDLLNAQKYKINRLAPPLLALFLDPQICSLRDCGDKDAWKARSVLFSRAFSTDLAQVNNLIMPHDGTHFRHADIARVFEIFGIKDVASQQRLKSVVRINEVVGHRNAVAHGRETAETIGARYAFSDIIWRFKHVRKICSTIIATFAKHCNTPRRHRRAIRPKP